MDDSEKYTKGDADWTLMKTLPLWREVFLKHVGFILEKTLKPCWEL